MQATGGEGVAEKQGGLALGLGRLVLAGWSWPGGLGRTLISWDPSVVC